MEGTTDHVDTDGETYLGREEGYEERVILEDKVTVPGDNKEEDVQVGDEV